MRYLNPDVAFSNYGPSRILQANPHRRRRNPGLDIKKYLNMGTLVDGVGVAAGFVLSETISQKVSAMITPASGESMLVLNYSNPSETAAPDLFKSGMDFLGHLGVGIGGQYVANAVGQAELGSTFLLGSIGGAVAKLAANFHMAGGILRSGSIQINHPVERRAMNPASAGNPMDVRASTPIPPVYQL